MDVSVEKEFAEVDLGDHRLNERVKRVSAALGAMPSKSLPEIFEDAAGLEAVYRLLRNPRADPDRLLEPHIDRTVERCGAVGTVLVAHDTTEVVVPGKAPKEGLVELRKGQWGFKGHFSLAVSASTKAPLGVVHVEALFKAPAGKTHSRARWFDPGKESLRWGRGVEAVQKRIGSTARMIHVMDREGDSFELLAQLASSGDDFVVRRLHDRLLADTDDQLAESAGAVPRRISDALEGAPKRAVMRVYVSEREDSPIPGKRRRHPTRKARWATLELRAGSVPLARPPRLPSELPDVLEVNVVRAFEPNPPIGEEPVDWYLLTSLPIATIDDVKQVVEVYKARWLIEEYFKAFKTGCAFRRRQLSTRQTVLAALALSIPVAWTLLALRHHAHQEDRVPATAVLTERQVKVLRAATKSCFPLPPRPTCAHAFHAIAKLGGHIKNNGPPGWLTLGRGFEKLRVLEEGYCLSGLAT